MIRPQPSPVADALWQALREAGQDGLTTSEAAAGKLASAAFARRRLRVWADAGFLTMEPGDDCHSPHRYFIKPSAPNRPPLVTAGEEVFDTTAAMWPSEFAAIRRKLGLSAAEMAAALGWSGTVHNRNRNLRRFETGKKPIDAALADKVRGLVADPR